MAGAQEMLAQGGHRDVVLKLPHVSGSLGLRQPQQQGSNGTSFQDPQ